MRQQSGEPDRPPTLAELLAAPINPKNTRRILEFCYPVAMFIEVDERGIYHILGAPGLPGHFQLGKLVKQKEWTPALDQSAFVWQTREEQHGFIHFLHPGERDMTGEIALVQHHPTYRRAGQVQVLVDIDPVLITPLWDGESVTVHQARRVYRCAMKLPCTCEIYVSLQQTRDYQQWTAR